MTANIQVGPVQPTSISSGTTGPGFIFKVNGRIVASVVYPTQTEAETARDTIAQALANASAASASP